MLNLLKEKIIMSKLIEVNKNEAIKIMEKNLEFLKNCNDADTFLLLSNDLESDKFIGRCRMDRNGGIKLIKKSKTIVLNKDTDLDSISTLSMYTAMQGDIYNIVPKGQKHEMVIIQQLE